MKEPTFAVVIPARLASTRLPRKVLLQRTGKFLLQHVWEQLTPIIADGIAVIVATDTEEVAAAAASFGARPLMTRTDHPTGTDRVAEVAATLDVDIVVNVQGDEQTIDPADIRNLVAPLQQDTQITMATLARCRDDTEAHGNPNIVKVVTDTRGLALYFSRAPVPYPRDTTGTWLHHTGVYAYRRDFLLKLSSLTPTPLERLEKLEQLRVLEHGYTIKVVLTHKAYEGIDTQTQYDAFVTWV